MIVHVNIIDILLIIHVIICVIIYAITYAIICIIAISCMDESLMMGWVEIADGMVHLMKRIRMIIFH